MKKTISIIIPNYNGAEILPQNLPIVLKVAAKYDATVIIVDDKSTDNSVEMLKHDFPQIQLIEKTNNEGFSSTVNLGVKNATTDLVCLLNSDVILTENCFDPLLPYFEDPQIAAVAMQDFSDDQETHGRGKFVFHRGFLLHNRFDLGQKELQSGSTGWVSCGSGLFSKKIWDELGGLDELLNPFYFEDVDYGYRAWKSGYKMYFEKESHVKHVHKKGSIKSNYDDKRIKTISYRNQFQVTWKNINDPILLLRHYLWLIINISTALKNGDTAFMDGFYQARLRMSEVKNKKQHLKKLWKLTDREILDLFT